MPELPEVETTKNGLMPLIIGRKIIDIELRTDKLRKPLVWQELAQLIHLTIENITRRAKYLIIDFIDSQYRLLIHLGMSGHLRVVPSNTELKKHEHVIIKLDNEQSLRYQDPRKFGLFLLLNEIELEHYFSHLGPEPLENEFNARYLYQDSRGRKIAIKSFIMQQEIVVGVGNIYATEALFLSKIHPAFHVGELSQSQISTLVENIKLVLQRGIIAGGTTLKDFSNPEGKAGYFQQQLQVYGRVGENCHDCNTVIESLKIGGRTSSFCPQCQKLPKKYKI